VRRSGHAVVSGRGEGMACVASAATFLSGPTCTTREETDTHTRYLALAIINIVNAVLAIAQENPNIPRAIVFGLRGRDENTVDVTPEAFNEAFAKRWAAATTAGKGYGGISAEVEILSALALLFPATRVNVCMLKPDGVAEDVDILGPPQPSTTHRYAPPTIDLLLDLDDHHYYAVGTTDPRGQRALLPPAGADLAYFQRRVAEAQTSQGAQAMVASLRAFAHWDAAGERLKNTTEAAARADLAKAAATAAVAAAAAAAEAAAAAQAAPEGRPALKAKRKPIAGMAKARRTTTWGGAARKGAARKGAARKGGAKPAAAQAYW
jgi:hypothetical protein